MLLGAPGLTTRSKDAITRGSWPRLLNHGPGKTKPRLGSVLCGPFGDLAHAYSQQNLNLFPNTLIASNGV